MKLLSRAICPAVFFDSFWIHLPYKHSQLSSGTCLIYMATAFNVQDIL